MFLSSWLILAGLGILLLLGALGWRWGHRRQVRARIATALRANDPQRRRASVLVATEQGLRANATLLAEHLEHETDPTVLDALVDGVLRNSWEPSDQPDILALRLWAHEQRTHAAAARRPAGPESADDRPTVLQRRPIASPACGTPGSDPGLPVADDAGLDPRTEQLRLPVPPTAPENRPEPPSIRPRAGSHRPPRSRWAAFGRTDDPAPDDAAPDQAAPTAVDPDDRDPIRNHDSIARFTAARRLADQLATVRGSAPGREPAPDLEPALDLEPGPTEAESPAAADREPAAAPTRHSAARRGARHSTARRSGRDTPPEPEPEPEPAAPVRGRHRPQRVAPVDPEPTPPPRTRHRAGRR